MKKFLPIIITLAVIALGAFIIFMPNKVSGVPKESVLYIGDGCPHCKIVEDFISANGVDKKITFATKEIFKDSDNAAELLQVWRRCGLNEAKGMSVPLFWDGTSCYLGDQEITNYFKTKI